MSEINIDGFFSLQGKVALITGGKSQPRRYAVQLLTDILHKQAQEALDYIQQPPFYWLEPKRSSSVLAKLVVSRASTKPSSVSTTLPQRKGYRVERLEYQPMSPRKKTSSG